MLTLETILEATRPEMLFDAPIEQQITIRFRELVKICHPDHIKHPFAKTAFENLVKLRDEALQRIKEGVWDIPGILDVVSTDGRQYRTRYIYSRQIDIGRMYVGKRILVYLINGANKDLYERAVQNIRSLPKYADDNMKKMVAHMIPEVIETLDLLDGRKMIVLKKEQHAFPLLETFDVALKGQLDPKHVAWCVSRLLHLSVWLKYAGIAHYGLSLDNLFVSTDEHMIYSFGGWWYTHRDGTKLVSASRAVVDGVDRKCFVDKQAALKVNLESARLVGRQLLGDRHGGKLVHDSSVPQPMKNFLLSSSDEDPLEAFKRWKEEVLPACFGPPKFIKIKVDEQQVYSGV